MTKKQLLEKFIETHKLSVTQLFKHQGGIVPFICVLSKPKKGRTNVSAFQIPEELIQAGDRGKDFVRDILIEDFKKMLKDKGEKILCVNWNSEAWMYKGDKDDEKFLKNPRMTPKTEVLFMTFDYEGGNRSITYEIKRKMVVNDDGLEEEVDVEFLQLGDEECEHGGRFSNLF